MAPIVDLGFALVLISDLILGLLLLHTWKTFLVIYLFDYLVIWLFLLNLLLDCLLVCLFVCSYIFINLFYINGFGCIHRNHPGGWLWSPHVFLELGARIRIPVQSQ